METDWSVVSRQHSLTSVGRLYSPRFLLTVRPKLFKFGQILWSLTSPSSLLQEGEPSSTCCGSVLEKRRKSAQKWRKVKEIQARPAGFEEKPKIGLCWVRISIHSEEKCHASPNHTQQGHGHTRSHTLALADMSVYAWSLNASVWQACVHLLLSVSCIFRWKYHCHADLCWPWQKCSGLLPLQQDTAALIQTNFISCSKAQMSESNPNTSRSHFFLLLMGTNGDLIEIKMSHNKHYDAI